MTDQIDDPFKTQEDIENLENRLSILEERLYRISNDSLLLLLIILAFVFVNYGDYAMDQVTVFCDSLKSLFLNLSSTFFS